MRHPRARRSNYWLVPLALAILSAAVIAGCGGSTSGGGGGGGEEGSTGGQGCTKEEKCKVFVAMSYSGNAWQSEASNLAMSIARTPPFSEVVEVKKEIAGTEVQAQISQYQSMIAAGADAIVSFPVSPTGLNRTIKEGCEKGVTFVMYDSTVTEPCAYNVSYITAPPRQEQIEKEGAPKTGLMGYDTMQWLAEALNGKGDIFYVRGVPGNSVDSTHHNGGLGALKKFPEVKIIDEYVGLWDSSTQQKETTKALAAHPDVEGIWAGYGASGTVKALEADGLEIPVAGETENWWRLKLKEGWPGVSAGSPPAQGGIAMKVAMSILENGPEGMPLDIQVPLDWVTSENVKECKGEQYETGCNVFPAGKVPPEATAEIFQPELLPESSISASESGKATPNQKIVPLPDMKQYEEPPEMRYITREYCDEGWEPGEIPQGIEGCVKAK